MTEHDVAPYELVRPLAYGGMGWVYEGRAVMPWGDRQPVAIKVMHPELVGDDDAVALFHREAETSLRLNHDHPNLVTTYACGATADGRPYLVMEYVDGVSLRQLTRDAVADDESFFAMVRRIAHATLGGLLHLHAHGVIHRDVSPGNILLGRCGSIKLADMGLCKALDTARSVCFRGTVAYASAESLACRPPAPSFDLYSLAAVLYELLTGALPYGAGTPEAIVQNMADRDPGLPAATPPDLAALVLGLLAMRVEDRAFHSAAECLELLQQHGEPVADDADMGALVERLLPRARPALTAREVELPVLHAAGSPAGERRVLRGLVPALVVALGFAAYLLLRPAAEAPPPITVQPAETPAPICEAPAIEPVEPAPAQTPAPDRPAETQRGRPVRERTPAARGAARLDDRGDAPIPWQTE